jgi:magnesium transporter
MRLLKKRSHKAGLPPGTAVHIGERKTEATRIRALHYDETRVTEQELAQLGDCAGLREASGVTWVHVTGVHDVALLERLGACFDLHPLVIEDISNTDQRPKLEDYGAYAYLVLRLLHNDMPGKETVAEQVSLVIGRDFVLSFEEGEPTAFEPLRERIRADRGRIRAHGADFLAYSLLDAVVDGYFGVLERFGDRIEQVQDEVMRRAPPRAQETLTGLRREMVLLRKAIWPLRDVIGNITRGGSALFGEGTWLYLRDVHDHVIHAIDTLESFHEMLSYLLDVYLLSATNRLNEIMKVLTLIATVFIPPTFIASVYGMNFRHMPELEWVWAYPAVLGSMLLTGVGMLYYFKKKKWA